MKSTSTAIVSITLLLIALSAAAQDTAPAPRRLANTLSAGVTVKDGNTESVQANASLVSEAEKEGQGSIRMGLEGNYGESTVDEETETTAENAKAFLNTKKTLSQLTFLAADASLLYDEVAEIDYRVILGLGPGYYVLKNENTRLSLELGLAYLWEQVADVRDHYLALRAAERFEHAFSPTARLWQSVEYIPEATDLEQYLIEAEIGVEAALNSHFNLRLVLQDRYDSQPGEGLERNDVALISGISIKF